MRAPGRAGSPHNQRAVRASATAVLVAGRESDPEWQLRVADDYLHGAGAGTLVFAQALVVVDDFIERLLVDEQVLGSKKGMNVVGAIGSRDGQVPEATMTYADGRKGGFGRLFSCCSKNICTTFCANI